MRSTKEVRSIFVTIRFNQTERKKLDEFYRKTTSRSLGEYSRSILLKEPVIIRFRNESADEFMEEFLALKRELNAIGNNFNQLVHKLYTLESIPEIKTWAILNESSKKIFMKKVDEIAEKMSEIYEGSGNQSSPEKGS